MYLPYACRAILMFLLLVFSATLAGKPLSVIDDRGERVTLAVSARRIVALTPHIAEILVALGVQDRVVGYVEAEGEPVNLPRAQIIGTIQGLNIEKIIALKPDLIIAWEFMPVAQKTQLERIQIPVFISNSRQLSDIVYNIRKIGQLVGSERSAASVATQVYKQLAVLRARYQHRRPVSVFFQVWASPLITIGNHSILNDAIKVCGGHNIFDDQAKSAFSASLESVIVRNPQVILATVLPEQKSAFIRQWRRWPKISAAKYDHLYIMDVNRLSRPSHLLLEGVESLCQTMDKARQ